MANTQNTQIPDEFKNKMNQMLNEYQEQSQAPGSDNLQEFLSKKADEEQQQEKKRQQEQQQTSTAPKPQFSGGAFLKDLSEQVGEDPQNNTVDELRKKMSQDGQPVYHYQGDSDAAVHDIDVTKKMSHTDSEQNGVFNSPTNADGFNFNRSFPKEDNGDQFSSNDLTQEDKEGKASQIHRIENKTFKEMADAHADDMNYEKTQEGDAEQHKFTQKDGKELTSDQHEGLKDEYMDKFDKNAEQDEKQSKEDAPEAESKQTDLPKPSFISTQLSMQPTGNKGELEEANMSKKADEAENKSVSPQLTR